MLAKIGFDIKVITINYKEGDSYGREYIFDEFKDFVQKEKELMNLYIKDKESNDQYEEYLNKRSIIIKELCKEYNVDGLLYKNTLNSLTYILYYDGYNILKN